MGYAVDSKRGVVVHYGARGVDESYGGIVTTSGRCREVRYKLDLAEEISGAPSTSNVLLSGATNNMAVSIPAYSRIKSCTVAVLEALSTTGGSAAAAASIQVGLEQADGTQ
jgi:hypothetical protein